jgi:hypothetical protein
MPSENSKISIAERTAVELVASVASSSEFDLLVSTLFNSFVI